MKIIIDMMTWLSILALHKSAEHRTGITCLYDVEKSMDPETGKYVRSRLMAGRLDDNGNVVPASPFLPP